MVAVLQPAEPLPRRLFRRQRAETFAEWIPVGEGKYRYITARPDKYGRFAWEDIRQLADRAAGRMLLPPGFVPPKEAGLRPFQGQLLGRELMAVTAVHLIRMASVAPGRMPVAVYDPKARMPQLAPALLPYTADVWVVTSRPDIYAAAQRQAMEEAGAAFPVTQERQALHRATLVLAPDGLNGVPCMTRGYVLSGTAEEGRHVVGGYIPEVPPAWLAARPDWCDPWVFLSAMYEWGGLRSLVSRPPAALWINGRVVRLRDAACRLAGLDIGISV